MRVREGVTSQIVNYVLGAEVKLGVRVDSDSLASQGGMSEKVNYASAFTKVSARRDAS